MRNIKTRRAPTGLERAVVLAATALIAAGCRDDVPTGIRAPALAVAGPSFVTIGTTPAITQATVSDAAGDQTDPHISGSLVSYTSNADGTNRIRYHDLATGADAVIANAGEEDFLSDVSGSKIVFTRVGVASSIYLYDVAAGGAATELAASTAANRRDPAIGGNTVAWQAFEFSVSALEPEIVVHELATPTAAATTTRLTNDKLFDRSPFVSPDGNVVIWLKCQTTQVTGTGCDIWKALKSAGGGWSAHAITGLEGEERLGADTDGQIVAYASTRVGETDIYWQPVTGGAEQRIELAGIQTNPSISGGVITFDSRDASTWDVWAYNIASETAFGLTTGSPNETLNDVWVSPTGEVRVVYQSDEAGDFNVYARSVQLPGALVPVEIDVNPGSTPIPIKLSGLLPVISVIVRTTTEFDAALIKASTATLGDGAGIDAAVATTHSGVVLATLIDVDHDGDKDLVLAFKKAVLVATGDLVAGTTKKLVFRAQLTAGRAARGEDVVEVIP